MDHVYLVHFYTGEYAEMLYPIISIKYVLTNEPEAIVLVEVENQRLKKRQDFEKAQLSFYEKVPIGKPLFD